jgi:hypothetical protein
VQWTGTNENMPTLYYGIKYNTDLVKFFIPLYQNLSPEELNAIPNIDNTNLLICSSSKINMDIYKSIIKLPINFKNTDKFKPMQKLAIEAKRIIYLKTRGKRYSFVGIFLKSLKRRSYSFLYKIKIIKPNYTFND